MADISHESVIEELRHVTSLQAHLLSRVPVIALFYSLATFSVSGNLLALNTRARHGSANWFLSSIAVPTGERRTRNLLG